MEVRARIAEEEKRRLEAEELERQRLQRLAEERRIQKEHEELAERQQKREETAVLQESLRQLERELEDAKRVCVHVSGNMCMRTVLVLFFFALFSSQ